MSISCALEVHTEAQPEDVLKFLFPDLHQDTSFVDESGKLHVLSDTGLYLSIVKIEHVVLTTAYLYGIDPTVHVGMRLNVGKDVVQQEKEIIQVAVKWMKEGSGDACLSYEAEPILLWQNGQLIITTALHDYGISIEAFEGLLYNIAKITPDPDREDKLK